MSKKCSGRLWVIEGIDGAGTTTQAHMLIDKLNSQGIPAIYACQPSKGPIGKFIRQVLKGHVKAYGSDKAFDLNTMALLFSADRLDHVAGVILPNLQKGVDVVCDRYFYSTMAYQGVGGDMPWIEELNSKAPRPDRVFFLDISAEKALARVNSRNSGKTENEIYENQKFLEKVVKNYRKIFRAMPELTVKINGVSAPDVIAAKILQSVNADVKRGR